MRVPDSHSTTAPDGYDLIEQIGAGAWGEVWSAVQRASGRTVAVKFLAPALRFAGEDAGRAEKLAWRFQREIEAASQQDHPNIAHIYSSGMAEGRPWYAMEFVPGMALDAYVEGEKLPQREMLRVFLAVCEGVQHAHERGVIHRDLKPANILVREDGTPKILDFGLARFLDDTALGATLSLDGQTLGTAMFMAPEQAAGKMNDIGVGVDVYALGVILYRLATKAWPYDEKLPPLQLLAAMHEREPIAPRVASAGVSRDLEAIILKALAKQRGDRYTGVAGLVADLRRLLNGEPVRARAWTVGYVCRLTVRKHWSAFATAAFVCALCAVFATMWLEQRRQAAERNARALDQAREVVNVMLFNLHGKLGAINQGALYAEIAAQAQKLPWPVDAEGSASLNTLRAQAMAANSRGEILMANGDAPRAMEAYREAVEHLKKLVADFPAEPRYALDLASTRLSWNTAVGKARHHREAVRGLRVVLDSLDALRAPELSEAKEKIRAEAHRELGETFRDSDKPDEAEKEFVQALALFSKPPAADPLKRAWIQEMLGDIHLVKARAAEAVASFSEAEACYRRELAGAPQNRDRVLALARCLARKAIAHLDQKQIPAAQTCLDGARDICPAATEKVSLGELSLRRRIAHGYGALAKALSAAGDDPTALDAHREGVAVWRIIFRSGAQTNDRIALIDLRKDMAETYLRLGRFDEAANCYRVAVGQAKRLTRDRVDDARWLLALAEIELRLLGLPRTPLSLSRRAEIERIGQDLTRFDELAEKASKPHRAKADELRKWLAAVQAEPEPKLAAGTPAPPPAESAESDAGEDDPEMVLEK